MKRMLIALFAAVLLASVPTASAEAQTAASDRQIRTDPWLTLGPGQASTRNEYRSAYPKPPPADYQSATEITRPPLPECSEKGYRVPGWNEEAGKWRECERPSPPYCGRGETPKWAAATGRWLCKKPVRPVCQAKGYVSDWDATAGEWGECGKPPAVSCPGEYPVSHWNPKEGEWGCWASCGDGGESYTHSTGGIACRALCDDGEIRILDTETEGYVWCYPPCDSDYERYYTSDNLPSCRYVCEEQEVRVFQAETGSVWCLDEEPCHESLLMKIIADTGPICIPTPEAESVFWDSAFTAAGLDDSYKAGKWIGGLASTYFHPVFYSPDEAEFWEDELGHYAPGEWAAKESVNTWQQEHNQAFTELIAGTRNGTRTTDICYGHDCDRLYNCPRNECGRIGSTSTGSTCRVYLWTTLTGLHFLMRIDTATPLCLDAYNKVAAQTMNQASISSSCYEREPIGTKKREGVDYPLYENNRCGIDEITLTDTGRDNTTWTTAKDYS